MTAKGTESERLRAALTEIERLRAAVLEACGMIVPHRWEDRMRRDELRALAAPRPAAAPSGDPDRELAEWRAAGQEIVDLFDPLKSIATPVSAVHIARAAKQAHDRTRADRDDARKGLRRFLQAVIRMTRHDPGCDAECVTCEAEVRLEALKP